MQIKQNIIITKQTGNSPIIREMYKIEAAHCQTYYLRTSGLS